MHECVFVCVTQARPMTSTQEQEKKAGRREEGEERREMREGRREKGEERRTSSRQARSIFFSEDIIVVAIRIIDRRCLTASLDSCLPTQNTQNHAHTCAWVCTRVLARVREGLRSKGGQHKRLHPHPHHGRNRNINPLPTPSMSPRGIFNKPHPSLHTNAIIHTYDLVAR